MPGVCYRPENMGTEEARHVADLGLNCVHASVRLDAVQPTLASSTG